MVTDVKVMDYEEYLLNANEEEIIFIRNFHEQGQLLSSGIEKVKEINERLNILVITSTMCKDSATIMPFLMKLAKVNKNINIKYVLKNGNEEILERMSGETRIPSIMLLDSEGNVKRKIIEFPSGVKKILKDSPKEKTQEIIDDMRSGKYNNLIQDAIIKLFTGNGYSYTTFVRQE